MIASLDAGEEVVSHPPPGEHTVEGWLTGMFCFANQGTGVVVRTTAGKRSVVLAGLSGFQVVLTPIGDDSPPLPASASRAPLPAPAAAVPTAPNAAPVVVEVGNDSWAVERLPAVRACHAAPRAKLSAKGPGFETYTVGCSSGDVLLVRCEMGTCRVMR
jgi:hypothetical protein